MIGRDIQRFKVIVIVFHLRAVGTDKPEGVKNGHQGIHDLRERVPMSIGRGRPWKGRVKGVLLEGLGALLRGQVLCLGNEQTFERRFEAIQLRTVAFFFFHREGAQLFKQNGQAPFLTA